MLANNKFTVRWVTKDGCRSTSTARCIKVGLCLRLIGMLKLRCRIRRWRAERVTFTVLDCKVCFIQSRDPCCCKYNRDKQECDFHLSLVTRLMFARAHGPCCCELSRQRIQHPNRSPGVDSSPCFSRTFNGNVDNFRCYSKYVEVQWWIQPYTQHQAHILLTSRCCYRSKDAAEFDVGNKRLVYFGMKKNMLVSTNSLILFVLMLLWCYCNTT